MEHRVHFSPGVLARCVTGLAFIIAAVSETHAQTYPDKPIKIIVAYPAGTGQDVEVRQLAPHLAAELGQPVIVENRGGNAGLIGMELLSKAAPDGYTFGGGTPANLTVNPRLYDRPTFDVESLVPVSQSIRHPWVLYVSGTSPANTLQDLVTLAKAKPGVIPFASSGIGSTNHVAIELFQTMTGAKFNHIPYGNDPWTNDLLSGQVQATMWPLVTMVDHLKAGKVKALAISNGGKRSDLTPNIPQFGEVGLPSFDVTVWAGFVAPSGTPKAIVERFAAANAKAAQSQSFRDFAAKFGATPVGSSPDEFAAFLKSDRARWKKVIADAGIKME